MSATSHTSPLSPEQAGILRQILDEQGFDFVEKPYTLYAAKKGKLSVAVYEKGPKVLVQGKATPEFIEFTLEPRVLGEARQGYEEIHDPAMFEPHFGVDESGKGDFFGPLVIAGAYVDRDIARQLIDAGIQDSKAIKSDSRIRDLAATVRQTPGLVWEVIRIGPERYNQLYASFKNLNKLLAWGHAKTISVLLEKKPGCPRALSDQFANPRELLSALEKQGAVIELQQRTKAESDVAVAAASILARESFIDWLRDKGAELGVKLPRGCSGAVRDLVEKLRKENGTEFLSEVGKTHFKFTMGSGSTTM